MGSKKTLKENLGNIFQINEHKKQYNKTCSVNHAKGEIYSLKTLNLQRLYQYKKYKKAISIT